MRITLRDFDQRLYLNGPADTLPKNALRRARGIHLVHNKSIRSRSGSSLVAVKNAHSMFMFNDKIVAVTAESGRGKIYLIDPSADPITVTLAFGGTGNHCNTNSPKNFAAMPVGPQKEDYLFIGNALRTGTGDFAYANGRPIKMDKNGVVSNWGIEPPAITWADVVAGTYLQTTVGTQRTKTIYNFDQVNSTIIDDWTTTASESYPWPASPHNVDGINTTGGTSGRVGLSHDPAPSTANSLQVDMSYKIDTLADAQTIFSSAIDLTTFSDGTTSAVEDYIMMWVLLVHSEDFDYIQLDFSIGDVSFNKCFSHQFFFGENEDNTAGTADVPQFTSPEQERQWMELMYGNSSQNKVTDGQIYTISPKYSGSYWLSQSIKQTIAQTAIGTTDATWVKLKVPKSEFIKYGEGTANSDWSNIKSVRIQLKTNKNGGGTAYFDDLKLVGGVGMVGKYKYTITYYNSATGARSNPPIDSGGNVIYTGTGAVDRPRQISVRLLPYSPDPAVTDIEIWRTVGNGTVFFRCGTVNNDYTKAGTATGTKLDKTSDHPYLSTASDASYLESYELPLDNIAPYSIEDNAGNPANWWDVASWNNALFMFAAGQGTEGSGLRGRLYYTPPGRPESVRGFIYITNDSDHLQRIVPWNGNLYLFSQNHIFQVTGTDPYVAREVYGCPGTLWPHTVSPSPYGIIYGAVDGIRVFDGRTAQLVSDAKLAPLFRGDTDTSHIENLSTWSAYPYSNMRGVFANNEYILTDGSQTIALNLDQGTWRDIGVGYSCILWNRESGNIYATSNTYDSVWWIEDVGETTDAGYGMAFEMETARIRLDPPEENTPFILERIVVDANIPATSNQEMRLITSDLENVATSAWNSGGTRAIYTYDAEYPCKNVGLRISGTLSEAIEIFGIDFHVRPCVLSVDIGGNQMNIHGECWSGDTLRFAPDPAAVPTDIQRLFFIKRFYLDCYHEASGGTGYTPRVFLDTAYSGIGLTTTTNTSRQVNEWAINRIGHLWEVRIQNPGLFQKYNKLYGMRLEVEPLQLLVRVFQAPGPNTQAVTEFRYDGRLTGGRDYIDFDIPNFAELLTSKRTPLVSRLFVDLESNNSITPRLDFAGEDSLTLSAYTSPTRTKKEWDINKIGRLYNVRVTGDFDTPIKLRRIELDVYDPQMGK